MDIIKVTFDPTLGFSFSVHWILIAIFLSAILIYLLLRLRYLRGSFSELEIDEAEIGIGNQKIKVKPNLQDLQVAYSLWVELSTRKIGLEIDLENDTILDIYDSWLEFFRLSRELVKDIPVSKIKNNHSTKQIVAISLKILNNILRPHLTKWHARLRAWQIQESKNNPSMEPQLVQKSFPEYSLLKKELLETNKAVISYKKLLDELIHDS
ncbi:MAG: hypothetical protein ABW082_11655 [Sedimenticola sp.]